jgi:hypothetical protein
MMTPERLEEIRRRVAEASEGPWFPCGVSVTRERGGASIGDFDADVDATFAAAARQDVPELLAEVAELRERCSHTKATHLLEKLRASQAEVERLTSTLRSIGERVVRANHEAALRGQPDTGFFRLALISVARLAAPDLLGTPGGRVSPGDGSTPSAASLAAEDLRATLQFRAERAEAEVGRLRAAAEKLWDSLHIEYGGCEFCRQEDPTTCSTNPYRPEGA